jgi:hypothetical protein
MQAEVIQASSEKSSRFRVTNFPRANTLVWTFVDISGQLQTETVTVDSRGNLYLNFGGR